MTKLHASLIALSLAVPTLVLAAAAQHGVAIDIKNSEIDAAVKKTASAPVSDQQLRVISVDNEYNVGVGVVHRAKTAGRDIGGGIEHSQISEVYHIISGTGTLVTGGAIENEKPTPANSPTVTTLNGPSSGGGKVVGGTSRKLGPGDVVIIPPNTAHWWTEITTDQIVYLVVRVDPHKVLPAGYVLK